MQGRDAHREFHFYQVQQQAKRPEDGGICVPQPLSQVTTNAVADVFSHGSGAQESEMGSRWAECKVGQGWAPSELWGRIHSCLFWLLETTCTPWMKVPSLSSKPTSLSLTLLPPPYKGCWDDTESPGNPGSAPTPSATSRPLRHTKLQDQDVASLGGISP